MIRFYAPELPDNPVLPADESAHAVRVLRRRIGDELEAVDGRGSLYRCRIISDNHRGAAVEVVATEALPKVWKPTITVAVAPTKNMDRMEWLVEKLVEIGVDRIIPVRCARSERKEIKTERLEKIAVSAMKQSLKAILPTISPLTPIADFYREFAGREGGKFVGYCDDNTERRLLARSYRPDDDATILIGPEGDFSPDEIEGARKAGFQVVTMGDNRLRTETAALVGCDTIHIINQLQ